MAGLREQLDPAPDDCAERGVLAGSRVERGVRAFVIPGVRPTRPAMSVRDPAKCPTGYLFNVAESSRLLEWGPRAHPGTRHLLESYRTRDWVTASARGRPLLGCRISRSNKIF